jgi:hypothetical protein
MHQADAETGQSARGFKSLNQVVHCSNRYWFVRLPTNSQPTAAE